MNLENFLKWDREDCELAYELKKFIESPVGQKLRQTWALKREEIIIEQRKVKKSEESAFQRIGKLEGYDLAISLIERIIQAAEDNTDLEKSEKERDNLLEVRHEP